MIGEVNRGNDMPGLVSYLFGPGKHNEHTDQHLVAGYADAVFTADDTLWHSKPGTQRNVRGEARDLGWQVEYPRSRWHPEGVTDYVWHCSLSLKADEGQLTDEQWAQAAHTVIDALGFSNAGGKAACRWVAVRHGLSAGGNDHIHLAVNLVREDGTRASTWNDYRKLARACHDVEERFGLQHVTGRETGRRLPEPSRKDREISAARGEPGPLRIRLERKVRACAAAARSEADFLTLAQANGLLIRFRRGSTGTATGYAVAEKDGRLAYSRVTKSTGPVWFGGGKLASDLSLPRLRQRWQPLAAPDRETDNGIAAAADLLAVAATACGQAAPGPLCKAARHLARAAQDHPASGRPEVVAVISSMASTFADITQAAAQPQAAAALALVREAATLIDTFTAARKTSAMTKEITSSRALIQASLTELTRAANRQAAATLTTTSMEVAMTSPTHEDEFLTHLTQAGLITARVLETMRGTAPGAADTALLRTAGYRADTPYDGHLRAILGARRWAMYVQDPARIVCAAAITDGAAAGYDMPAVLAKVFAQRPWEDDPVSSARSIARVMAHRIAAELARPATRRTYATPPQEASEQLLITARGTPARNAEPITPFDGQLRDLLGPERWHQYEHDPRRRDVADLLTRTAADGRDIGILITDAVTCREWEDDRISPARRVGGVLLYRLEAALGKAHPATATVDGELPSQVTQTLSRAGAPGANRPGGPAAGTTTSSHARTARPQSARERD